MTFKLEDFLGRVEQADGLNGIQSLIVELRDHYGVDHIVYHWMSSDGEQYGCGTYDQKWVQRYVDRDYLRIDPVVIGTFQRFHPVDWKQLDWSTKAARAFRQDAMAHGVGNQGLSIPIRGPNGQFALFTVSTTCSDAQWTAFAGRTQRELLLISHYFNLKALELETGRHPEPARQLSPREIDTLSHLAMGYSRSQVAEMLNISEHTLRAYVESARFKLGASNTTHAVARATAEGLIMLSGAARSATGDWPGKRRAAS